MSTTSPRFELKHVQDDVNGSHYLVTDRVLGDSIQLLDTPNVPLLVGMMNRMHQDYAVKLDRLQSALLGPSDSFW